jgi:hypothetical protein
MFEIQSVLAVQETVYVKLFINIKRLCIFLFPPILLFNPLQFSPIIRKIPCCFVFGATL